MKYTTKKRACFVMQRFVGCVCNSVHLFIPFIVAIASSVSGCSLEASEPRHSPKAASLVAVEEDVVVLEAPEVGLPAKWQFKIKNEAASSVFLAVKAKSCGCIVARLGASLLEPAESTILKAETLVTGTSPEQGVLMLHAASSPGMEQLIKLTMLTDLKPPDGLAVFPRQVAAGALDDVRLDFRLSPSPEDTSVAGISSSQDISPIPERYEITYIQEIARGSIAFGLSLALDVIEVGQRIGFSIGPIETAQCSVDVVEAVDGQ